jgi:hypothetical protein
MIAHPNRTSLRAENVSAGGVRFEKRRFAVDIRGKSGLISPRQRFEDYQQSDRYG